MHNSSESNNDIDGPSLFGGEDIDTNARHPADVPLESLYSVPFREEAGAGDDDDPFADEEMERLLSGRAPGLTSPPAPRETEPTPGPSLKGREEDIVAETSRDATCFSEPKHGTGGEPKHGTVEGPKHGTGREPKHATGEVDNINFSNKDDQKESTMPTTTESEAAVSEPARLFQKDKGLTVKRRYTQPGIDIWATVEWELRTASITGSDGTVVFEQKGVEIPKGWSQLATNVVVSKYFRGHVGTLEREYSVKQLIGRVADRIIEWGKAGDYFATDEDASAFHDELRYILMHQMAAFNSPVWFNLGWPGRRQAVSACYINEVDDTMESILELYKTEGMLFKDGSGSGVNLSTLRSKKEPLAAGGKSSGPVSFMKGLDASAGSIKSGGSTRRAACMRVLDVDHPDIRKFIDCKKDAELKAHALIEAGFSGAFNVEDGAYDTVPFQNANHSVRVTDEFMQAVENDGEWQTTFRTSGKTADTFKAREILKGIAEGTWVCGDPGMQYDTTINDWHTCSNTDRIYASNPCSEYMFLNSTACNLSSLNLMKFRSENGAFDTESFEHAVRIMITAQEIVVGFAAYPTEKIEHRSHVYRTLGLGYANLGALLMADGLAYDSDAGRAYAGAITAIMTGRAYEQSAAIARDCGGPFPGYAENKVPMLRVIEKHRESVHAIDGRLIPASLKDAAQTCWDEALAVGKEHGYRNAQATVLAPTGTIGFLMDCDTTGIEPDIAIVKYKSLVGGGMMKIVNQTVPEALQRLGYSEADVQNIIKFIDENDTIEGAPALRPEHLPIFDCAFRAANGTRSIHYMGHIKMMAAAQPFISGAISKTVNVPQDCTVEEIAQTYTEAWKLGLKAVAIYRDGSKKTQPLSTAKETPAGEKAGASVDIPPRAMRRRLPDERASVTHKFSIGGHEGYITVGLYPDTGAPGEIFIRMAKEGSSISGLMDSFATAVSLSLQYGVPLSTLVDKFIHSRFEPSGFTNNKEIPMAKSVMDYIFRWLALKFLEKDQRRNVGLIADIEPEAPTDPRPASPASVKPLTNGSGSHGNGNGNGNGHAKTAPVTVAQVGAPATALAEREHQTFMQQSDAPPCPECGAITIRSGACYKCPQCGTSLGCS